MKLLNKTKFLLVFAVLMGGVSTWEVVSPDTSEITLPRLNPILKDEIQRIELTQVGNTIVLENNVGNWTQVSPLAGSADWPRIKSMILNFRKSIPMDVLVELNPEDDGKEYGLDASNSITVEMWSEDGSDSTLSFVLGYDTNQGSSFVRLPNDNAVYRASVGGRRRFTHSADNWLNQRLFPFDFSEVKYIDVELAIDENVDGLKPKYLIRKDSSWGIEGYSEPLDIQRLSRAIESLSVMRIGDSVENIINDSWMTMTFGLEEGRTVHVQVNTPEDRQTQVLINQKALLVPALPLERFSQGPDYFKDSRVFPIQSREELDLIRYQTEIVDIIIQQDLSNGFWNVLQPSNIDLEMRDVFFMVNTLAALSSTSESLIEPSFTPKITLEIRRLNGEVFRLFIYSKVDSGILCRIDGQTNGFVAIAEDIERIINGFGQAEKL